jgi:thymidine kinase
MAVYFYYSAMNAGKSTYLLQAAHNYEQQGMNVLLLAPSVDNRYGVGRITSRIGLSRQAQSVTAEDDLLAIVADRQATATGSDAKTALACVLVDEAHFLTKEQVSQLMDINDRLGVPVLSFGLRTDAFGNTFEGSERLLALADKLIEQKTICHCGAKATMVARYDEFGNAVATGSQVEIGDASYRSLCRKHYKQALGVQML